MGMSGLPGRFSTIFVDLDGTIADPSERMHLKPTHRDPPEAWVEFYGKVGMDKPIVRTGPIMWELFNRTPQLVYITGRDESCRDETKAWLKRWSYPCFADTQILMRPTGDTGTSAEVKRKLLEGMAPFKGPVLAIDDEVANLEVFLDFGFYVLQSPRCWDTLSVE
jgi:hypothetical protein